MTREQKHQYDQKQEECKSMSLLKKMIILFSIIVIFIFAGIYYSRFIATSGLKIKEYTISNNSIPESFHGSKIIHISDVHYKTTIFKDDLKKLVKKINIQKPDIIVLTGDLLDRHTVYKSEDFKELSSILSKLDPEIGKYAITGNHDTKYKEWESVIENSGFTNLNDKYELLYKNSLHPILLSGVSSNINNKKEISERLNETINYIEKNEGKENNNNVASFKVLLTHEPDYIDDINFQKFDLILGGHSHNGQIRIPYVGAIVLPVGAKKYYKEYYQLENTELYISSGLGTSTIPYRLFNKPSINLYRLKSK